jgi:class 3 adenylate cyclase
VTDHVSNWLARTGFGQYAKCFTENAIDFSILCDLTDQDLEKIGVSALGHRRRLLRAIAELKNTTERTPGISTTGTSCTPQTQDAAERRQLTIVFSDLVGSTALSARLDPEDMREIIAAYHQCCATAITKFDGFVAKYIGDGVLAYFGYPQAHEDDAERAVRSALSLTEAVPKLDTSHGMTLQVRIGIATGLVVVGDLIGEGDAQERAVVGDTRIWPLDCKQWRSRGRS